MGHRIPISKLSAIFFAYSITREIPLKWKDDGQLPLDTLQQTKSINVTWLNRRKNMKY